MPESAVDYIESTSAAASARAASSIPEDFLVAFAARKFGRPVKWVEDRREHFMAIAHSRETECEIEIACDRDGTILGLRGDIYVDIGAYVRPNGMTPVRNVAQFLSGPYRIPNIHLRGPRVREQQDAGRAPIAGRAASKAASSASGCSTWRRAILASTGSTSAGAI